MSSPLDLLLVALPTRIYLTGFMGSGKSTVGPIVANVLGYDFLDLDAFIEELAGKPIPAVFADDGEAAFRRQEAAALEATTHRQRLVVALGGGALASEANMRLVRSNGAVVYLHLDLDRLVQRLQHGQAERPLLCDADGTPLPEPALRRKVAAMLAARKPFYRQADATVDVTHQRVGQTVDAVVASVRVFEREVEGNVE